MPWCQDIVHTRCLVSLVFNIVIVYSIHDVVVVSMYIDLIQLFYHLVLLSSANVIKRHKRQ